MMKRVATTAGCVLGPFVLGLLLSAAAPSADAQTTGVGGSAYGALVNSGGVVQQTPVAVLPADGGMVTQDVDAFGVSNVLASQSLTAITTGAADDPTVKSAQSISDLEQVSVLGGLITADGVTAVTSSYVNASGAASDARGSGFVNLVVNGLSITTDVAPNTQVALPGVGYVVLNEQSPTGNGMTSSSIAVNMIHVVLQDALTGAKTGEIIVGSAASSVGS